MLLSVLRKERYRAALGGITYSWIMLSGYTLLGLGMEIDAIASSVIGGTQLMGGVALCLAHY